MSKKTIVIDMDDVITSGGLLHLINEYCKTSYTEEDFKDFYMQDKIADKYKFFEFFLKHNQYDYSDINEGAQEVIEELCEKYEVFIGTSFIFKEIVKESGVFLKHKYDFLYKHFPFIKPMNYAFVGNKSVLHSDIKIDDKVDNLENAKVKLLYTAYHNKDIKDEELIEKGIIRVNNWSDIKNILLESEN
jgi:5'(3')-deoxyribonucleotidase